MGGEFGLFNWSITVYLIFSRLVRMVGKLLFFVYWFLDKVRFIKEVQKTSRPFLDLNIYPAYLIYSRFSIFQFLLQYI